MSTTTAPRLDDDAAALQTPPLAEQAPILLSQVAGYVGFRTVALGLRAGLVTALAAAPAGLTADELAEQLDLDPFYVAVWARGALAAGVCDRDEDHRYRLVPHMTTLLLDTDSPAHVGGVFDVLSQPEVFDRFEANLASGERTWWDETSHHWIAGVAGTGRPFYTRLVPAGLAQIPGLADRLARGGRIVDTACGAGVGLVRLAEHFPAADIIGVDGDGHSLELAARLVSDAGLDDRVTLLHQPLEELVLDVPATLVINNISMHECRDIDEVVRRVRRSLEPGGWFVISDFPFPDTAEGLRSVPGRIMSGIQFFEAQIDDQLLPRSAYDELLSRHGFREIGSVQLTPMHAVTYGRA
jgi:ubiquinone/menaquinone biosynthesis C-methylase UbiE